MSDVLQVDDLSVEFYAGDDSRAFHAVKNARFSIESGNILGMVGESGCGKSVTSLALLDLLPESARVGGTIRYQNREFEGGDPGLSGLRGRSIGMIFQEPMTALNPVFSIGNQLEEVFGELRGWEDSKRIRRRSVELLRKVQLDRPEDRLRSYPHQLSGGQRQRVMIALSLAGDPDILIADEPTTALDVTLEAQIMKLFRDLADEGLGVLLISHDLALVGDVADNITVMYSGYNVEWGAAEAVIDTPQHPYTQGLVASSTALSDRGRDQLPVIPGEVPSPQNRPSGCPFHPRCHEKEARCEREFPDLFQPTETITSACWAREQTSAKDAVREYDE